MSPYDHFKEAKKARKGVVVSCAAIEGSERVKRSQSMSKRSRRAASNSEISPARCFGSFCYRSRALRCEECVSVLYRFRSRPKRSVVIVESVAGSLQRASRQSLARRCMGDHGLPTSSKGYRLNRMLSLRDIAMHVKFAHREGLGGSWLYKGAYKRGDVDYT